MTKLPQNWCTTNLGELIEFKYGKALPERTRSRSGFPVYGSNGIVGYHDDALTSGATVIVGRKGSVGEINYSDTPCSPIDTTYYVDKFPGDVSRYWFYQLKILKLNELNKATAIPGLNRSDAYNQVIALAPLNEQKRIADKLDAILARVDACRQRLDRIPAILKRFRQSVLAAAISGKLTEEWRAERGLLLDSWLSKAGREVFSFITSGSRGWAAYYSDKGARFLRVGNLDHDTINLDLRDIQHVTPPNNAEGKRTRIVLGDILISITADIGMVGYVSEDLGESYINQHLCLARQSGEHSGTYLAYFLASSAGGLAQLTNVQRGATKAGLTLEDIRTLAIQLPSKNEQIEIVRRVEALFAYADRLEARYTAARAQVEKLTPALLAKAFRGELVPQDPNDEPASVLLERIRLERIRLTRAENAAKPQRPRRKAHVKDVVFAPDPPSGRAGVPEESL